MTLASIVTLIGELSALIAAVVPVAVWMKRVANGSRCQLRSEMLSMSTKTLCICTRPTKLCTEILLSTRYTGKFRLGR